MVFGHHYFAGTPATVLVLVLTAVAFLFALLAVLVSFFVRGALVPGVLAGMLLFAAVLIAGVGVGAGMMSRNRMERALTYVDPSQRELMEQVGGQEADQPMLMGLLGAAIPGMAGLGLAMLAIKRRSGAGEPSLRDEVTSP